MVLDEATAFVDPDNEALIQEALAQLIAADKTMIIIAHRLHTITSAHQILLVEDGEISSRGTHEELLQKSASYRSMWEAHIHAREWHVGANRAADVTQGTFTFQPPPSIEYPDDNPYENVTNMNSYSMLFALTAGGGKKWVVIGAVLAIFLYISAATPYIVIYLVSSIHCNENVND